MERRELVDSGHDASMTKQQRGEMRKWDVCHRRGMRADLPRQRGIECAAYRRQFAIVVLSILLPALLASCYGLPTAEQIEEQGSVPKYVISITLRWARDERIRDKDCSVHILGSEYAVCSRTELEAALRELIGQEAEYDPIRRNCFHLSSMTAGYVMAVLGNVPIGTIEFREKNWSWAHSACIFVAIEGHREGNYESLEADYWIVDWRHDRDSVRLRKPRFYKFDHNNWILQSIRL
jgi:hypothetical protein